MHCLVELFVVWAGKGYSFPVKLFATSPGSPLDSPHSVARAQPYAYIKRWTKVVLHSWNLTCENRTQSLAGDAVLILTFMLACLAVSYSR